MLSSSSRSAVLLLLAWCLVASGAAADAKNDALLEQGIQLRRERRDVEALVVFEEAYARNPEARVRVQIALAKQALARWADAERDLVAALNHEDTWIVQRREALEQSLAKIRDHLGSLRIESNVERADLTVNGARLGALTSAPLRIVAGEVVVELSAPGYQTRRLTVLVAPGRTVEALMKLEPRPAESPATAPSPPRPVAAPVEPRAARPAPSAGGDARSTAAWIAAGGAGALLVGSVVLHIVGENAASTYNDDSQCLYGGLSREERCGGYRAKAEAARTGAIIGYGLAGLAASTSAYLFLSGRTSAHAAVGSNYVGAELRTSW